MHRQSSSFNLPIRLYRLLLIDPLRDIVFVKIVQNHFLNQREATEARFVSHIPLVSFVAAAAKKVSTVTTLTSELYGGSRLCTAAGLTSPI